MTLLDACASMCAGLKEAVGPEATEWISIAAVAGLAWWQTRKVGKAAQAGIAAANEQASKAKAEARDAKLSLARIEGSLRPAASVSSIAPTLPPLQRPGATPLPEVGALEGLTSASGTYQPIRWDGTTLPKPAPTPSDATTFADPDVETRPATPTAKKKGAPP